MATLTTGTPLIDATPQKRDSPIARQFVLAGLALLTAVALPVGKSVGRDLPARAPDHIQERQFVSEGLARRTFVALPSGQRVGLDLAKPPPDAKIGRDWTPTNTLARQLAVTLPFGVTDWPLPRRVDSALNRYLLTPGTVANPYPFDATDWPLAKKPLPPAPETVPLNIAALNTVVVVAAPFSQSAWPPPQRIDSPGARYLLTPGLGANPVPFQISDWPLAKKGLLDLSDPTAAVSLSLTAQPFAQLGWTLPARTDSPIARDWVRVNDLPRQLQVALPFNLVEWPLPKGTDSPLNRYLLTSGTVANPAPFHATQWESTQKAKSPAPETTPLNIAAINTVVIVPQPFNLLDWSRGAKLIDSPAARHLIAARILAKPTPHDDGFDLGVPPRVRRKPEPQIAPIPVIATQAAEPDLWAAHAEEKAKQVLAQEQDEADAFLLWGA